MRPSCYKPMAPLTFLFVAGWFTLSACGQPASPTSADTGAASVDAQEAARRKILDSDRWRRTNRGLNEWLSVQHIYSPDEVAAIRASLEDRIGRMSPRNWKTC